MMTTIRTISHGELTQRLGQGPIPQFWNVLTDDYFQGELGIWRSEKKHKAGQVLPQFVHLIVHVSRPTRIPQMSFLALRAFSASVKRSSTCSPRAQETSSATPWANRTCGV